MLQVSEIIGHGRKDFDMSSFIQIEESYCHRCNMCICDTCYSRHSKDSGNCSSHSMSVREEALNKLKKDFSLF